MGRVEHALWWFHGTGIGMVVCQLDGLSRHGKVGLRCGGLDGAEVWAMAGGRWHDVDGRMRLEIVDGYGCGIDLIDRISTTESICIADMNLPPKPAA